MQLDRDEYPNGLHQEPMSEAGLNDDNSLASRRMTLARNLIEAQRTKQDCLNRLSVLKLSLDGLRGLTTWQLE